MALSGVRSSWLTLARNCDLCWLATSSSRLFSSISVKRLALWMASADCAAKVSSNSTMAEGKEPGARRRTTSAPMIRLPRRRGTTNSARKPAWRTSCWSGRCGVSRRSGIWVGLPDGGVAELRLMAGDGVDEIVGHAMRRAQREFLARLVEDINRAGIRLGKLDGFRNDGREDRGHIERRVDGLADLAQGTELLDRLRQLAGAQLDLFLEIGIGLLEPAAHVVELVGEHFELVARLDRNALGEVAAADAQGAGAQGEDRPDHPAGKEKSGEAGKDESRRQEK